MTEAIVVGIIVGLFSGLLGTIAGPYVGLKMDRRRRNEVREEERRRQLREMLEAKMLTSQRMVSACSEVEFMVQVTTPAEAATHRDELLDRLSPDVVEQGHV